MLRLDKGARDETPVFVCTTVIGNGFHGPPLVRNRSIERSSDGQRVGLKENCLG